MAQIETCPPETTVATMHALVYHGSGKPSWELHGRPVLVGPDDALVRVTTSTICGTDLQILKGDLPAVIPGRILGHGVVDESGSRSLCLPQGRQGAHFLHHRFWEV